MATTVPLTAHAGEKQDTEHTGSKREGRLLALSSTVSVALALALIVLTYGVRLEASRLLVLRTLLVLLDASAHFLRYFLTFLGREPYFPPRLELAAALPLITLGIGVLLFYPS